MISQFKKVTLAILINGFLIMGLILTIQNSNHKNRLNLLFSETILLPVSFITGISFLSGSLSGSLLTIYISTNKK